MAKLGPYAGKRVSTEGLLYPRYEALQDLVEGKLAGTAGGEAATQQQQQQPPPSSNGVGQQAKLPQQAAPAAPRAVPHLDPSELSVEERKRIKREKRTLRRVNPGDGAAPSTTCGAPQPGEEAAAAAAAAAPTAEASKKAEKKRKRAMEFAAANGNSAQPPQQQQQAGVKGAAGAAAGAAAAAKGNAEEAKRIREALGYVPPSGSTQQPGGGKAAKQAAGAGPSSSKKFAFGFNVQQQVEAETDSKIARLMAMDATKDGYVARRVWLCGMPHEYSEEDVRAYWEFCGPIEALDLLRFKDTGRFNGAAFITFATEEAYKTALAYNGEELEGRSLKVDKCKVSVPRSQQTKDAEQAQHLALHNGIGATAAPPLTPAQQQQLQQHQQQPAGGGAQGGAVAAPAAEEHVAYVGNVAFEATQEELQGVFQPYGGLYVRLHTDKKTGRPKGFAHAHFGSKASLDSACAAVDGTKLHDRNLKVAVAQPKQAPGSIATAPAAAASAAAGPAAAAPAAAVPAAAAAAAAAPVAAAVAAPAAEADGDEHVAYVGNVAFEATQEELEAVFEPHGATQVRLHADKRTGRPKGFAHAHFGSRAALDSACIAANGAKLHDRNLKVMVAQAKAVHSK